MEIINKIPLFVTYRCTQCSKMVTATHLLREKVTVSDKETVVWMGSGDRPEAPAGKRRVQMGKLLTKIREEEKKGSYRSAAFSCRCPHCGHREPWAKMRYLIPDMICVLISPVGAILTLAVFPVGISILGVAAACILAKRIHQSVQEKKIRRLPQQSLPHFALSQEESVRLYEQSRYSHGNEWL